MRIVLAAGGVVRDVDGRLLLVRRSKEPEAGRWNIPGGHVEVGESLEQTAAREVLEETGIIVEVRHEVWWRSQPAGAESDVVYEIHEFLADPVGGILRAGDDVGDARWFTPHELRHVATGHGLLGRLRRAGLYS